MIISCGTSAKAVVEINETNSQPVPSSTTAGTRGATTEAVRTITFSSESLTTMVTLTPLDDGTVRVDGWAAPGAGIRIDVLLPDGPRRTYADEDGRFVFEGVPSGLAKFALYLHHGAEFFTVLSPAIEL